MGFQTINLKFTITRDQFIHLLLLNGEVKIEGVKNAAVVLNGIRKHIKFGEQGVEDGSLHSFSALVSYNAKPIQASATATSCDAGKTYHVDMTFEIYLRSIG